MKKFWIGIGLVVLAIAWYAFRPELLFINNSVSESFPVASVAATTPDAGSDPKKLAMGQFKGYAHEAQGNADGLTVVSSFASGAASLGKPARRPPGRPCRALRFLLSHPSAMGY